MSNIHKNTLDCKIVEDLLPLYYDGAVNDTTKKAVESVGGKISGIILNELAAGRRKEYSKSYQKYVIEK